MEAAPGRPGAMQLGDGGGPGSLPEGVLTAGFLSVGELLSGSISAGNVAAADDGRNGAGPPSAGPHGAGPHGAGPHGAPRPAIPPTATGVVGPRLAAPRWRPADVLSLQPSLGNAAVAGLVNGTAGSDRGAISAYRQGGVAGARNWPCRTGATARLSSETAPRPQAGQRLSHTRARCSPPTLRNCERCSKT